MQCIVCHQITEFTQFTLGSRPLSTEFSESQNYGEKFFEITLGICGDCFTIQLTSVPNFEDLIPRFPFIPSNEPEDHLDFLTEFLINNFETGVFSNICGLSHKDSSLLKRLEDKHSKRVYILDKSKDFEFTNKNANIESIQHALSIENDSLISKFSDQFSMVIARHILEHSSDVSKFIQNLKSLLRPDGYLLIEVPDSTKSLMTCDYSMVWEEHTIYLNTTQLTFILETLGFEIKYINSFELPYENSIVVFAQKSSQNVLTKPSQDMHALFSRYNSRFEEVIDGLQQLISVSLRNGKRIGIFGAGHFACAFVHYFGLQKSIKLCFDDTPSKIGRFLPGTSIPIVAADEITKNSVDICLLAVSLSNEQKVLEKFNEFTDSGATIYSIFVNSSISVFNQEKL